jgi:hypothetical protein
MSDWNTEEETKFPQEEKENWNDDENNSKFPTEEVEKVLTPKTKVEVKVEIKPEVMSEIILEPEPLPAPGSEKPEKETGKKIDLRHFEGHLIKESTEKTHGHKRWVQADKINNKVRLTIWKDKKSSESQAVSEIFFDAFVKREENGESFKTTKKSPTIPKDKEFKYCIKLLPSRTNKKDKDSKFILWAESEKKAQSWETALNDMVKLINMEQEEKKAKKGCIIQ